MTQRFKVDIYQVNALVSAVESAREDVLPSNGECLVAFTELIRQTLEALDGDLRPEFLRVIGEALAAGRHGRVGGLAAQQCFRELRRAGFTGVVSFSDPVPRTTLAGDAVFVGHIGTIYQAHNAAYLGRGTARTLRLLPDGTVFSARTIQKIRAGERGWRPAAAVLEQLGADPCPGDDEGRRAWVRRWLPVLTRPLRHPGNHKYAWSLDRAIELPRLTYPRRAA